MRMPCLNGYFKGIAINNRKLAFCYVRNEVKENGYFQTW